MHRYKQLTVWQESIDLVTHIYEITNQFPNEEKFGLISQIKRAAVSIPVNIAEGAGRNSTGEFKNFLGISQGSTSELETLFIISTKLGFLSIEDFNTVTTKLFKIQNMLEKLKQSMINKTKSKFN